MNDATGLKLFRRYLHIIVKSARDKIECGSGEACRSFTVLGGLPYLPIETV
jgi:hypothetical protein